MELEIDLEEGSATVRLSQEAEVSLKRSGTASTTSEAHVKTAKENLRKNLQNQLENELEHEKELMRQKVTELLEAKLRDVQQELDRAVNRTTANALKKKAAQLGEIEEIHEDQDTGSMTIRVRL